ncbi:polysaccharide deacetylase family protein [Luedemannella flava]|uniref:polysaccharide deacetylase family protein n=1 Tax=Luedemannella flava TaxID=349316 RepID=UPI0031E060B4
MLSSELLGFGPEARVLIINCDDFGMYGAVNAAVVESIERGIASSCSLMVPCPGAAEAMRLLGRRQEIPFGIHLTLVRDTVNDRWRPLTTRERVPSLLDGTGELFTSDRISELLANAQVDEVACELRAQVTAVLDAGLAPTHLDWHCLADGGREDIFDATVALAHEYGLAVRVWLDPARRRMRQRGLPVVDNPFVDSFRLDIDTKAATYARLLRDLPVGLSEWAVHPGQAQAHVPGWQVRRTDYEFLTSPQARDLLDREGIVVTDYRALQRAWAGDVDLGSDWYT